MCLFTIEIQWKGVHESQHEKVLSVTGDGIIQSPDFPNTYPRNTVIVWRLVAVTESSRIQLTFDPRFGLEDAEDGICKYDYVEVEEPVGDVVLGRWCGSEMVPGPQVSKGNQILIRFVSDEYFPSDPGFCIRYSLLQQRQPEPEAPAAMPAWMQSVDVLSEAVAGFSTMEEVMKYLEPDRWQVDIDDLYKPTWQVLGKSFFHQKKARVGVVDLNLLREEVRLYSCTPRNFSVSLREELKRTDAIFWPSCLLVKRCGGNCACCSHNCYDCQCSPTKVAKKYHEEGPPLNRNFLDGVFTPGHHLDGIASVVCPIDTTARKYSQTAPEPEPVISDNEAINKTFVNRNPRNLEQMALAVKDRGWATVWPSRQYYHRLVFRRTQHHITAEVYSSDSIDPVLTCSTKEWALKRELGSTRSVAACRAVGEVLAQRCREAGITRIVYREVPWKFRSESNQTFWTAMKEGGIMLSEPRRKFI
ncbi:platelet-derived growth factor C [Labeo rohita]|uniref:Large ribosomal subunit protein uL18m n=1 Tax=Labeo rohita TaxID=84645 RepID=A0A498N008_LABRO|nr:platelet-derived growth factor C [Labeo rohita]